MSDVVLACKGLQKIYRSGFFQIPYTGLESLDLEVHRGEIFGFIGPNGAGKTTSLKCLVGLQAPTAGEAWLLGKSITDPESKRGVGFLPERPYFYEHLTARELLRFYGNLFDLGGPELERRIGELLERVDLGRFADIQLRSYSKGMLQRAGIAQALVNDPELVILDEPMSGLDPMGRMLIRDLIVEERRRGRTVFFSSHILSDVETICDRVGIIVRGRLRGCGAISELVSGTVQHVDIAFQGTPPSQWPVVARDAGSAVIRVPPDAVDAALDALRASSARILQVTPAKLGLEQIFLDEVERAAPANQKRMGVLA